VATHGRASAKVAGRSFLFGHGAKRVAGHAFAATLNFLDCAVSQGQTGDVYLNGMDAASHQAPLL